MDKWQNRSLQVQKGADGKKVQDHQGNKYARQKESSSPKCEATQKSASLAKGSKGASKVPAQRGNGRGANTKLDDLMDQLAVGNVKSSKKRNVSHLLNFQWMPRERQTVDYGRERRNRKNTFSRPNTIKSLMATRTHRYNKEQFLQANCQFVVKSGSDYSLYMADPDKLVSWEQIEQIIVMSYEDVSCPICLYEPVAGKMTRCGHIYCWTCVLHYLSLTDKSWRKCPICYESIHGADLKSVSITRRSACKINDTITFQLMKRAKGTNLPVPVSSTCSSTLHSEMSSWLPYDSNEKSALYSKLLVANQKHVLSLLNEEECLLQFLLQENKHTPELCFVEQALALLHQRKQNTTQNITPAESTSKVIEEPVRVECKDESKEATLPEIIEANRLDMNLPNESCSEEEYDDNDNEDSENESNENEESNISMDEEHSITTDTIDSYIYFYQATDGQQLFLHSLNARMIEAEYGSLRCAPHTIKGRVLEKEAGAMTTALRQRIRHLQHLPVTCQFEIALIDLQPPIVSEDTINRFKDHLEVKRRQRVLREREEKKLSRKAADEHHRQICIIPSVRLRLDSHDEFPEFGAEMRLESRTEFPECGAITPEEINSEDEIAIRQVTSVRKSVEKIQPTTSTPVNTFAQKLKNSGTGGASGSGQQKKNAIASKPDAEVPSQLQRVTLADAVELALKTKAAQKGLSQKQLKKMKKLAQTRN